MQEMLDSELMKLVRAVTPILMVLMLALSAIEGYFIKQNADTVAALQTQNRVLAQSQAESSLQFQTFLRQFTAESNFECDVLEVLAKNDPAHYYPPPRNICSVVAP